MSDYFKARKWVFIYHIMPFFNPISGINIVIIVYIFITEMSLFISSKQLKITGYNFQAEHAKGLQ